MTKTNTKRARYKQPVPDQLTNINLNKSPRYERILYWVYHYKYLTSYNIAALLYLDEKEGIIKYTGNTRRPEINRINFTGIQKSISQLWQHRFLQKWSIRNPVLYQGGSVPDIFTIGSEAIPVLVNMFGCFPEELSIPQFARKDKAHHGQPPGLYNFLFHNIEISNVLVALKVFCCLSMGTYTMIYSTPDKSIKEKVSYYNREGKYIETKLIPDGLVIIQNEDTGERSNFFIELDRQTETLNVWLDKMNKYFYFNNNGRQIDFFKEFYLSHPELMNGNEIPDKWVKNFRVLCATTSIKRIQNMLTKTISSFRNGKGSNMFIYTLLDNFNMSILKQAYPSGKKPYSYNDVNLDKPILLAEPVFYIGHEKYEKKPQTIFDLKQ